MLADEWVLFFMAALRQLLNPHKKTRYNYTLQAKFHLALHCGFSSAHLAAGHQVAHLMRAATWNVYTLLQVLLKVPAAHTYRLNTYTTAATCMLSVKNCSIWQLCWSLGISHLPA